MAKEQDEAAGFNEAVAQWDRRLVEAGDNLDAVAPSSHVWDRISARVDQLEAARETLTVPADQGVWEQSSPGVYRKSLHIDADGGWQAFLLKVLPGAAVPAHSHPMLEECLVLEGAFEANGAIVRKGDLHLAFAGHDHTEIVSHTGALLYIRAALGG
jgi:quercetin dioxygenase-like cupin family protein